MRTRWEGRGGREHLYTTRSTGTSFVTTFSTVFSTTTALLEHAWLASVECYDDLDPSERNDEREAHVDTHQALL